MTRRGVLRGAVTVLVATSVGLAGLSGTIAGAAPAKQVKVCVKKKTGEAVHLRKGKCRKGWKKVSWNSRGPVGLPGIAGPTGETGQRGDFGGLSLYANGQRVGRVVGSLSLELFFPSVVINGGIYTYLPDGSPYPNIESPNFFFADCSGTAYLVSSGEESARIIASWAGSSSRLLARTTDPTLGAVQGIWTPSGEVTPLPGGGANMYRRTSDGTCVGPTLQTGWTSTLAPASPPPNLTPPLTVR